MPSQSRRPRSLEPSPRIASQLLYEHPNDNESGYFSAVQRRKTLHVATKSTDHSPFLGVVLKSGSSSRGYPTPASRESNESRASSDNVPERIQNLVEDFKINIERKASRKRSVTEYAVPQLSIEPPRPAKEGHEWVWFPEGYWAERQFVDMKPSRRPIFTRRGKTHSPNAAYKTDARAGKRTLMRPEAPRAKSDNPALQAPKAATPESGPVPETKESLWTLKVLRDKLPSHASLLTPGGQRSGFLEKTWRHIGAMTPGVEKSKKDSQATVATTQTIKNPQVDETVRGATVYLTRVQKEGRQDPQHMSPTASDSSSPWSDSRESREVIGVAPWHKKTSQGSLWSVTSSIRELLRGRTPVPSLSSEHQYDYEDKKRDNHKELEEPTFLFSEAQRVKTPPLYSTPDGQARGFFFDMRPPVAEHDKDKQKTTQNPFAAPYSARANRQAALSPKGRGKSVRSPDARAREWWDVNTEPANTDRAARALEHKTAAEFVLSLPEHLPNSPLCPMHPKHRSGGKGVCVYHRRRKTMEGDTL